MSRKKVIKSNKKLFSQIRWGESYTSLFLGIVVVIIIVVLIFWFIKDNKAQDVSTIMDLEENIKPTSYIVKEGDDLWKISEKIYGSGYNWVNIVDANKIENPNLLLVGTKLTIPDIKPIVTLAPSSEIKKESLISIKEDSYKVVEGDSLWVIAIRAYGDGYKWTELAKANNLLNPDIIHPGNTIKIPR